jgi:hypothetical protein
LSFHNVDLCDVSCRRTPKLTDPGNGRWGANPVLMRQWRFGAAHC